MIISFSYTINEVHDPIWFSTSSRWKKIAFMVHHKIELFWASISKPTNDKIQFDVSSLRRNSMNFHP